MNYELNDLPEKKDIYLFMRFASLFIVILGAVALVTTISAEHPGTLLLTTAIGAMGVVIGSLVKIFGVQIKLLQKIKNAGAITFGIGVTSFVLWISQVFFIVPLGLIVLGIALFVLTKIAQKRKERGEKNG
ncbi:MAG: hypothetical protein ABIM30_05990 [candidate division WOR-3 bacterium]